MEDYNTAPYSPSPNHSSLSSTNRTEIDKFKLMLENAERECLNNCRNTGRAIVQNCENTCRIVTLLSIIITQSRS